MKKTLLLIALLYLSIVSISAAYTGRVFVDANKNGIYDENEKALKNVLVSDGLNVVETGADGKFNLPGHGQEKFIFITTPSGYKTKNAYYQPIDGKDKLYNFALLPFSSTTNTDGSHRFIQISDTEISSTRNNIDWSEEIRDYAINNNIAFIIHTGDICYEKGVRAHIELMNRENMGCPMFYCIGNHDLLKGNYGEELFESIYGPVYYSFDFGNTHYVVTPMPHGDHKPGYKMEDVYCWLRNDLKHVPKSKAIVLFNHDLITNDDKFVFKISNDEYFDLAEHNLKAWLYGHWHTNFMYKIGNVYTISTATPDKGGIDHSTSAFRVVSVDGKGDIQTNLRYTYINKQIEIASINENTPIMQDSSIPVSVNIYNSVSPAELVTYSCWIDGKVILNDIPLIQNTDWNWSAQMNLPLHALNRRVFITVKGQFKNGEVIVTRKSFLYKDNSQSVKMGEDWLTLLKNTAHTGNFADGAQPPLTLKWVKNIKANIYFSSPIISNGVVYVATVDEDLKGQGGIFALDAVSGNIKWKYKVRNSIKNSISLDKGKIYAQDVEGYLYAIDSNTGKFQWDKKISKKILPPLEDGLAAVNGVVYAGNGEGFTAYNGSNGEVIWQNKDWSQGEGTTSTVCVNDKVVVSGANWKGLYAHDKLSGKLLWSLKENGISNRGATPVIHNDTLYVISGKSLFIINAISGEIILQKEYSFNLQVNSTPLVTDGFIIFGSNNDGLIAVDKKTLNVKWKTSIHSALIYTSPYTRQPSTTIETSPVLSGNTIYFGASDGSLYGVNIENGHIIWSYKTGSPFFSSVAISGNTLFAADFGGNVYAFTSN